MTKKIQTNHQTRSHSDVQNSLNTVVRYIRDVTQRPASIGDGLDVLREQQTSKQRKGWFHGFEVRRRFALAAMRRIFSKPSNATVITCT